MVNIGAFFGGLAEGGVQGFELSQRAQDRAAQRKFREQTLDLQKRRADLAERQAKAAEKTKRADLFFKVMQKPKKQRNVMLKLFAPEMGMDPKGPEFQNVLTSLDAFSDEELAGMVELGKAAGLNDPEGIAKFVGTLGLGGIKTIEAILGIAEQRQKTLTGEAQRKASAASARASDARTKLLGEQTEVVGAESKALIGQREASAVASRAAAKASEATAGLRRAQTSSEKSETKVKAAIRKELLGIRDGKRLSSSDPSGEPVTREVALANRLSDLATRVAPFDTKQANQLSLLSKRLKDGSIEFQAALASAKEEARLSTRRRVESKSPIPTGLANLVGVPTSTSIAEARSQGIEIPDDVSMRKINETQAGGVAASALTQDIIQQVEENPISITFGGSFANFANRLRSNLQGLASVLDFDADMNEELGKHAEIFQAHGIQNAATKSMILDMAFVAAISRGQTGRGLSDKDVERFSKIIGQDQSDPKALKEVLTRLQGRLETTYRALVKQATGKVPALTLRASMVLQLEESGQDISESLLKSLTPAEKSALKKALGE